jgi:hypothetical protein
MTPSSYTYKPYMPKQFMFQQWVFKCHFCRDEFSDPVAIGIHFRDKHNYNLKNDEV